jgi:Holliday junction DNA helicase RuvA
MVLELAGKLVAEPGAGPQAGGPHAADVVEALVGLGWPEAAAAEAVAGVDAEAGAAGSAQDLLRAALKRLAGRR